ncbi:MAG: hypothetical protein QNK84_08515 [Flavobacteriales bacterium]
MGKRLKIVVIGLPLFAKRIVKDLSSFDKEHKYISLDTYYSKVDKVKYYLHVRNADIVYSINGTLTKSGAIDLALKLNKKVIMHWVGTDVLKSTEAFNANNYIKEYIAKCSHWCEVEWIKEELKAISINAQIVNFASFHVLPKELLKPKDFSVLTYIAQKRSDFYGLKEVVKLAQAYPQVTFNVMGCEYPDLETPNLHFKGWVNNGGELIENSTVCLRFTEHDGLSNFILEALSKGRKTLYNNSFPCVNFCKDYDALKRELGVIYSSFEENSLEMNTEGVDFIKKNFNKAFILSSLIAEFKNISKIKN